MPYAPRHVEAINVPGDSWLAPITPTDDIGHPAGSSRALRRGDGEVHGSSVLDTLRGRVAHVGLASDA